MKRFFLFFFASVLSISMFAANDGSTKAKAIPYNWTTGIPVESTAGVGKWYVVNLLNTMDPAGPFNALGETTDGKTNINVMVVNSYTDEADINVVAYIGDNETDRHFKLASGASKSMTFGAGMFVKMGIDRVYLYLVMDVTITPEEAAEMETVHVNVTPVENENSVVFIPDTFKWDDWPAKTLGATIQANKETWVMIEFDQENQLDDNMTYKFYAENAGPAATILYGGVSYDCPATSIQEESKEIQPGAANASSKVLDQAKLDMMPSKIYIRIKADQEIRLYAEQVPTPQPEPGAPVILNKNDAHKIELDVVYDLASHQVYKVGYNTLKAQKYYYKQIEVTNNGSEQIEIIGKATKTFDNAGNAYSATSKSVTIPAGETYVKKIDKTMLSAVGSQEQDTIWAIGPNADVTFKLAEYPEDPEYCHDAIAMAIPAAGSSVSKNQKADTTVWYAVDITAAKAAQADIMLTMTAAEAVDLTVDIATACAMGEPTQTYTGSTASTSKTLSYSLIEGISGNVVYVRVKANKAITVQAEIVDLVRYTSTGWVGTPAEDKVARIEADLTINSELKVLGITLAGGNIIVDNTGKLIIGKEGIKGSESVDQIIVEDGGVLLIKDATSNHKPFVTVKDSLHFGATVDGARRAEKHEFIALPVDDREAAAGVRYYGWEHTTGWVVNGFNKTFIGYDVFQYSGHTNYKTFAAEFKGRLADNKNQTLSLPGEGWHAFGNSWLDKMDVDKILAHVGAAEEALHVYVATPQDIAGTHYGSASDEKLYLPLTSDIADATGMTKIAPMQGFFLYTTGSTSATLKFSDLDAFATTAAPAPAKRVANNTTKAAVVVRGGNQSDFVYMIEGEAANAHKMMSNGLAIYAEDGLTQIANTNLIGTMLTIQTNEATEYTLSFTWLKGETLYLKDLANGKIIAMTAENTYTFNAEPNSVSERFQVVGRNDAPTGIENNALIEGANKRIENGKMVIIKNGVKYDVLGAQL